jgi:hypothetical protein
MQKHLIVQRTDGKDWYDKGKDFLSKNKCKPLALEISSDVDPALIFQQALSSLNASTGQDFKIDADAPMFVVTADFTMSVDPAHATCGCQCGAQGNCCGSGSGGGRPT